MRTVITGIDSDGRSCIVSQDALDLNEVAPGFAMGIPYATNSSPPPARPQGTAPLIDQFIAPGHVRWMIVDLGPNSETPMHHTDTLDLETVVSGSVELVLDDGAHQLEAGDLVVLTGVDHAWRTGSQSARLSAVLIGTPPPDAVE